MPTLPRNARRLLLQLLALAGATGCAAAAGAAAGAAAAVYLTERGASAQVNASLDQTATWTRDAFSDLGIRLKEVEKKQDERKLKGTRSDLEVTAELDREESGLTRIEVTARRHAVIWDKEYAQRVLARIIRRH